jgi:hypothetical protein
MNNVCNCQCVNDYKNCASMNYCLISLEKIALIYIYLITVLDIELARFVIGCCKTWPLWMLGGFYAKKI